LHPFNRNRVFEQIRGFTGTMLRPGDQAMLALWRGGLRIEVPFTSLVSEYVNETVQPRLQQSRDYVPMAAPESHAPSDTALFDVVGRAANANGVTIYMLSASTGLDLTESLAESREIRSADVQFLETMNRISAFQHLASRTGGLAFVQSGNIEGVFDRIERDFDTYYSIGYHATRPASPGERKLVVRSKRPGIEIRTRTSYYARRPASR
jgi:hypothetical protein